MIYGLVRTDEFAAWFFELSVKEQAQIDSRLARVEEFGHFGDCKNLGDGLAELRWKNGRRIYFSRIKGQIVLLLNGGLKNAQVKDIKKARLLLERYARV